MTLQPPETVGGILLAAGTSSRFGADNKLLATVDDTPIVTTVAKTLVDSHLTEVVVIVGHQEAAIRDALAALPVSFRENERYRAGQSTSVTAGSSVAWENDWDGALFALGDMPFVQTATINSILSAYSSRAGTIVAPVYNGTRGNPVLFDQVHYDALGAVTGDVGGRRLIEEAADRILVETDDAGVCYDIDTKLDLQK